MKQDQTSAEQAKSAEIERIERSLAATGAIDAAELQPYQRPHQRLWSEDDLRNITSFEELERALNERPDVQAANAASFGNGYTVLDNKEKLIGVDLVIIDWQFNQGEMGTFVSCQVLTRTGERWIMNDGSTGICDQLKSITTELDGGTMVLRVPKGLRKSDYSFPDPKTGEPRPARTYYISYESAQ